MKDPTVPDLKDRKKWLAFFPKPKGCLFVDEGAYEAIINQGSSLLASGLKEVDGSFEKSDVISISTHNGEIVMSWSGREDSFTSYQTVEEGDHSCWIRINHISIDEGRLALLSCLRLSSC